MMKRILDNHAYDFLPVNDGLIVIERHDDQERKYINYKYITVNDSDNPRPVTRAAFLETKFNDNFDNYSPYVDNYLLVKVAPLSDGKMFFLYPITGKAFILNSNGNFTWQGNITYQGKGPDDIAVFKSSLWCSYSDSNVLVRYSLSSMREEIRIGGGDGDKIFNVPSGIFVDEISEKMLVCNRIGMNIVEIDLNNFRANVIYQFNEPIFSIARISSRDFVHLESGIYEI